uniref:Mitochondrial import receptor subunit TOM34 n=2 Tax=Noccaea caerulescens TaxID=107243 RepID=A0A1J3I917_NOCCA
MASATTATATASGKVEKGHQLYRDGKYKEALLFYTEALTAAKTKPQKIALHSNRAACYLKLHEFKKAAEECTWVLELDQKHSGALMLRAQTLVTLKEYQSALFDVSRLMELNPDSEVYQNLEARLRTQLSLAPIPESEAELEEEEDEGGTEEKESRRESVVSTTRNKVEVVAPKTPGVREENTTSKEEGALSNSNGWQAIPKPKGHSTLDYARWDTVEDDEDGDSDDSDESRPQYRFRVKTVGVRPVK